MQSFESKDRKWFYITLLVAICFTEKKGWEVTFVSDEPFYGHPVLRTEEITMEEVIRLTKELRG